jgi:hypothetical protein
LRGAGNHRRERIDMVTVPRQLPVSAIDVFTDDEAPSRGFLSQLSALLFQPGAFFRTLGRRHGSRRWIWAAILILMALAFSAVQRSESASTPAGGAAPPMDMPAGPDGMPFDAPFPPEGAPPAASSADPAAAWMTGLTAAGAQIVHWIVLALVLSEVTMFNGRAPRIGVNLQIVIWASVPLALMAVVQMIFIAGGGSIGKPGLTGFLESWEAFADLNIYLRSFLHGLASHLTLFWLRSLGLLYIAARQTLRGRRPVVFVVLLVWIVILGIGSGVQSYRAFSTGEAQAGPDEIMPLMETESGPDTIFPEERLDPAVTREVEAEEVDVP